MNAERKRPVRPQSPGAQPRTLQRLLTTAEAAEILNICARQMRRYIERGDLRTIKIGRIRRIDQADLHDFISGHRSP